MGEVRGHRAHHGLFLGARGRARGGPSPVGAHRALERRAVPGPRQCAVAAERVAVPHPAPAPAGHGGQHLDDGPAGEESINLYVLDTNSDVTEAGVL